MHVRDILVQAAERFPGREAVVDGDRRVTYGVLSENVLNLAASLLARGIAPGDRVAIGMRNSLDHVTVFLACQALGVGAVPFNIRLKPDSIAHIVRDSGARAIVLDDCIDIAELRARRILPDELLWVDAADQRDRRCEGAVALTELLAASSTEPDGDPLAGLPPVADDDLSAIIYTSGTTGLPKGVPITQRNAYARLVTYIMSVGPTFDSGLRTLGAAPLYHTVGMHWVLLQTLFTNGTYYPVSKVGPETAALIREEGITFLFGSPTLFKMLLEVSADPLPSVRHISYGSAPAEPELLEAMYSRFPHASISEVYGTTELSIPFVTPSMRGRVPGALRRTGDHRVRIVRPAGNPDDVVAPGEVGELLVHLDNDGIFSAYWGPDGQAKREDKCVGRWFRTGDGFRYDAEGNFYFDGRLDDLFISGGENIQPAEVENTLNGMPGVLDCTVMGIPDPTWGNVVTAFIVTDGRPVTEADVDEYCRGSSLENYKRPRRIHFVEEIPRNPSGKIVRAEARRRFHAVIGDVQTFRQRLRETVPTP
ncbi:class I adenylate-forming enzyme family protein [Georgenia yuyongxinii]|uniref:Acyl--CoA ligase n=1 Tax=Georgenia yuyongxinii TaxID=2589797 RepID=A0A552WU90_9MICO|nr:class I adenylate-forming enzyme family protein [Georgenia yuyongxinii]TRW45893.1 acyl--CoA ligase [Georgenia yuyongxinii]